jgi:Asp-tRNA(Asn)/Glu-tRNA(Gln) amidotransferase A subunit family amidase
MYLARIEAYDKRGPALNAIGVTDSKALEEADARDAERRSGARRGPLHGIPLILKDNYETIGMHPYALDRNPGGSSGGTAAAVGANPCFDAFLLYASEQDRGSV